MTGPRFEGWEQREAGVLGTLPFVLLAICLAVSFLIGEADTNAPLWLLTAVSVATAAWMLWWTVLHRDWRDRPRLMVVYFAGLIPLMAALVLIAPWYGFFTFTGYFAVVLLPERVWPVGVAAVAVVTATSQNGGLPTGSAGSIVIYALVIIVNVGVASAIMFFAYVGEQGHQRRAQLVEELEATLRENEALQEQLVARAREDGVVDERQRMARELHDTLAQGLAGIITQLEAAEQARDDGDWRRHVDAARDLARESLTAARRSVHAMRPEPLEDARLADALAAEARRWSELQGVRARRHDDGRDALAAPGRRGHAAARGAGGARERGQARLRRARRAHAVLHGRRRHARRARRRHRLPRQRLLRGPRRRRVRAARHAPARRR